VMVAIGFMADCLRLFGGVWRMIWAVDVGLLLISSTRLERVLILGLRRI
jgi:hypothetical protein